MGKFSEALRRHGRVRKSSPDPPTTSQPAVKIWSEKVDALRLDTPTPEGPRAGQPSQPSLGGDIDPRILAFMEPGSLGGEALKLLRAKILARNLESRPRTIMVTSAQPMDGKTTLAINLAINIALGINEHVLLVECDLRRPVIAKLFGLNDKHGGVRGYLEAENAVAHYLKRTPVDKLSVLPGGQPPSNPSELLSSEKMRRLIQEVKNRYEDRYIILDSTPAHFLGETTALVSMVDGVLLVVRSGKTAKDAIIEAIDNLGRKKILGVIFNDSDEALKGYGYYYRYYEKGPR